MLGSISVKISWKWSLTAARTARWAGKGRPFVRSVMSQKSPASRWLLSLLSISALCDVIVFETHPLAATSTRQKHWDWQYNRDNTVSHYTMKQQALERMSELCIGSKILLRATWGGFDKIIIAIILQSSLNKSKIYPESNSASCNIPPSDSLSSLELVLVLTFVLVCRLWHSGQPRTKSLIWKYIPVGKLCTKRL